MTYQVLARKWRPQNFEEVVGQEPITRTLQNAISQGRIAHAFLFSGPRGVGKTSVARILAKALNCQEGPTPHPCNQCVACREITLGSSMDVLEIDGASNRGIDEVRDLREKIKYLPTHGQYKVYIIDEVHMLTKEAFNALLKTLEEPPAHAVFVLATTEPHKVPATILSRCQRYDFRRIATSLIQAHLEKLAAQEGWQIDPEGLSLIAREAEGGLRDAQGFLDQVVTFGGETISVAEIARILGVTERGSLLKALQAIIQRQGPELLELIDDLYNQGHDLQRFYQDLVWYARHLLLAGLHPEARHLVAVADQEWEEIAQLARQAHPAHLQNLLSVLLQGEEELKRAPQPRLALEVLLLRLIHLEPVLPVSAWVARLEDLEKRLGPGGARRKVSKAPKDAVAPPAAAPVAPAPEPPAPSGAAPAMAPAAPPVSGAESDLEAKWQQFLHFVQENADAPLFGKISKCRLSGMTDHRLQVEAGGTWNGVDSSHETRLQELAKSFFGPQYSLEIKAREKKRAGKSPAAPKKPVDLETLKQQALEIFGGQWVGPAGKEEPQ
ncbi:MAG: DNA polymerase III subunit gamma/tau [Syntrophales bacterium]|nr:DNA polymerase III subunit gamma/tau [Syntrophales bacterium]MDD5642779.1 DNA polymerase III subunit gamma/tau [Syntrophales bacterium]